jgi:ATP-GRASP peptide maturase of grasp-with-spasm system
MILIFSKSKHEGSTDDVIRWIKFFNGDYHRLNGSDFLSSVAIDSDFSVSHDNLDLNSVNICWFRRWIDLDYYIGIFSSTTFSVENEWQLFDYVPKEVFKLSTFLWKKLESKKWLTRPFEIRVSKLEMLSKAKEVGLSVPATIVTTKRQRLLEFKKKHQRVITKSIADGFFIREDNFFDAYSMKTSEVTDDIISSLGDTFFPSKFQELLEKAFEVRAFFFNNQFYAMAIFSQSDERTSLDFRNYNRSRPNRTVPYKLDPVLEKRLWSLINQLHLTSGSVDLVCCKTGRMVFLEINPVGQFGMTSFPCNYYIEKEIAKYLIENDV